MNNCYGLLFNVDQPNYLVCRIRNSNEFKLGNTMVFKKVTLLATEIDTRRCCLMF